MSTKTVTATTTLSRLQKQNVDVTVLDRDGQPDVTTPLVLTTDDSTKVTIAIDPTDNRTVILTGQNPTLGGNTVAAHVSCDLGAQGGAQYLNINCSITDVDLSNISATFDPPVSK